jgi:5'-3' exonuclease
MIRATAHVGSWISLSSLAGQVIAVDISCWLYLCLCISSAVWAGAGGDFSSTVSLVMERVEALARAGITPLLVFDGQPLPGKEGEAAERATARDASKQALLDHLAADGTYADENGRRLGRAMARRTPELTTQLMRKLRRHGYNFLVAAYEADMQVVYLERVGIVDAGLTGDGDLQMLGLHTVLYDAPGHRLDWGEGMVFRVARKDLRVAQADVDSDCSYSPSGDEAGSSDGWETVSCSSDSSSSSYSGSSSWVTTEEEEEEVNEEDKDGRGAGGMETEEENEEGPGRLHPAHRLWERLDFQYWQVVTILAGCDYTPGIKGVGLSRAVDIVLAAADASAPSAPDMKGVLAAARAHPRVSVNDPANTWLSLESLERAYWCMSHQPVFDPQLGIRVCPSGCDEHTAEMAAVVGPDFIWEAQSTMPAAAMGASVAAAAATTTTTTPPPE